MGYLKIPNLYKQKDVLLFKEVYCLEKLHGTSSHIGFKKEWENNPLLFSGGEKHENFVALFDKEKLISVFNEMDVDDLFLYGEAYGGKQQGMSHTYGKELKFIVFDVKINKTWLDVQNAEQVAKKFDLDFVWYQKTETDIDKLNELRDRDSEQAKRNGMGDGHKQEGIVIRPLIELSDSRGNRVIAKHKRDDFRETRTPRPVDAEKLKILEQADEVANEWVVEERLSHVIDKITSIKGDAVGIEDTGKIIKEMISDVKIEGEGEIVWSKDVERAIGKKTANLFKNRFKI